MKYFASCFLFYLYLNSSLPAQAPAIEWENTIGGNSYELIHEVTQTTDGGYIVTGFSNSDISGDKTENNCGGEFSIANDFWILKLDPSGEIEWQNTIGGSSEEAACFVFETESGDYIVAGSSSSSKQCDKTSNSYGGADYWVLKINSVGGIVYQMKIGGKDGDIVTALEPTADGGFVIGGFSYSSEIGGNKTEAGSGLNDYYVVKISPVGTIEWQNTIGTTADDYLMSLKPCSDGGYILGGYTTGGISGDKTEASMGPGYSDYWVIKLNSSGNIEWQNTIGGNFNDYLYAVLETPDGGFLAGGISNSGITGDKAESSIGSNDPWILKLNSTGSIVWQNTITDGPGSLYNMINTADGNFILSGGDFWICKLNALGDELWAETIGSGYNPRSIEQTDDLGYIIGGASNYGITDVKSEPNFGESDYWIVKLAPDLCIPIDEVCNGLDDNCNGLTDDTVIETISISADGPTTFCKGSQVTLEAEYSGTSVQWKKNGVNIPGATSSDYIAISTGDYSCVTTSECGAALSDVIEVKTFKKPSAFIYADGPTLFCEGSSVTLIANTDGGFGYQWYDGATPIPDENSNTLLVTTTGNYKCQVTKIATGCSKQSNPIAVSVPCKEGMTDEMVYLYPNPAGDVLKLQISDQGEKIICIYNTSGAKVKELNSADAFVLIDISTLTAGLYYIQVEGMTDPEVVTFVKK